MTHLSIPEIAFCDEALRCRIVTVNASALKQEKRGLGSEAARGRIMILQAARMALRRREPLTDHGRAATIEAAERLVRLRQKALWRRRKKGLATRFWEDEIREGTNALDRIHAGVI